MKNRKQKKENRETLVAFGIFFAILAVIVTVIVVSRSGNSAKTDRKELSTEYMDEAPPSPFEIDGFEPVAGCPVGALNNNLSLTCVGSYNGILAAIVENIGTEYVSFAEVKINIGYLDAFFEVTHLPVGSSVLLLETSDITYEEVIEFKTPLALSISTTDDYVKTDYASDFVIIVENGILTLENCSGRDFTEPVEVYCRKPLIDGLYFDKAIPLATEGVFANGDCRYFNFEDSMKVLCMKYSD